MTERKPAIGLVLGGGGIAGYAFHAAVLAALERHTGFDPRTAEIIVGTSAGAIAGAVLRANVPAREISNRLALSTDDPKELANLQLLAGRSPKAVPRFWAGPGSAPMALRELRRGRRMKLARLVGGLLPEGRISFDPISEPIDELHGDRWPAAELWIPATDLNTGRRKVFGRDERPRVAEAVRASAALPGFFAPAIIDDRSYVDGGLTSPYNADLLVGYRTPVGPADGGEGHQAATRPLDLVIVLAPLSIEELSRRSPVASAARTIPRRQLNTELRDVAAAGTKTLVFQPARAVTKAMGLNPMNHHRIGSIMESSERLTHRRLADADQRILHTLEGAGKLLASPSDVPYPG